MQYYTFCVQPYDALPPHVSVVWLVIWWSCFTFLWKYLPYPLSNGSVHTYIILVVTYLVDSYAARRVRIRQPSRPLPYLDQERSCDYASSQHNSASYSIVDSHLLDNAYALFFVNPEVMNLFFAVFLVRLEELAHSKSFGDILSIISSTELDYRQVSSYVTSLSRCQDICDGIAKSTKSPDITYSGRELLLWL